MAPNQPCVRTPFREWPSIFLALVMSMRSSFVVSCVFDAAVNALGSYDAFGI